MSASFNFNTDISSIADSLSSLDLLIASSIFDGSGLYFSLTSIKNLFYIDIDNSDYLI